MKAQELRIGNWLNMRDIPFQINSGFIYDLDYSNNNPERQDAIVFDDVEPIPLTEQWLIDFGFRQFGKDWSKNKIIIHTRKRGFVLRKSVPIIKYVHQLQNLYFALTGEELQL